LQRKEEELGIGRRLDPGALEEKIERLLVQVFRDAGFGPPPGGGIAPPDFFEATSLKDVVLKPTSWTGMAESFRREILGLLNATQRPRVDHRSLNPDEKARFNEALQLAYSDSRYRALVAVHEDMGHRMHSMAGDGGIGGLRFLPWHRVYLLKMEDLLRSKKWGLTIPYWNFSADRSRPDWVWQPPGVTRNAPGAGGTGGLPSPETVANLVNHEVTFGGFAQGIEFDAHNQVHNWCNGTITAPATASRDPIFWLLHANVDRIWDLWQAKRTGMPNLFGLDATMDPWPHTAASVKSVIGLGYLYQ
jgi:hypothetical protein